MNLKSLGYEEKCSLHFFDLIKINIFGGSFKLFFYFVIEFFIVFFFLSSAFQNKITM